MIFAMEAEWEQWISQTERGIMVVSKNCPDDILIELQKMNADYVKIMNEELLVFSD